jgi:hypothetical protein
VLIISPLSAHFKMMPDVPIVGWDVAFTPGGIYLLEVSLILFLLRYVVLSLDCPS